MNHPRPKKSGRRILLINPPYERLKGFSIESIPLGLLYIGTVLNEAGYQTVVYDADTDFGNKGLAYTNINRTMSQNRYASAIKDKTHPVWVELRKVINEYSPDFVGVTMMTPVYSSCREVFKIVREERPEAVLIAGGPHVTIVGKKVLVDNPELDFAFSGEAERSTLEFMNALYNGKDFLNVKGLIYRDGDVIKSTGKADRIESLDVLPIPDRELLYNKDKYNKDKFSMVVASRGCSFSCTFCAIVPLWDRKIIFRSPQNIVSEIDYLVRRYNVKSFGLWDDTFTSDGRHILEFCALIEKRYGRTLVWDCLSRANCLNRDVLEALKRAGCRRIKIGVESGSDNILQKIKKGVTTEQVMRVSNLIKRMGFWLHAYFMVGMPYETEEDLEKTIDFIERLNPDSLNLCTFMPYPGTELYDYIIAKGLIDPEHDYSVYDSMGHHSANGFFMVNVSRERYLELLKEALSISTQISCRWTPRKILLKTRMLTPHRIKRVVKHILRKF